MFRPIFLGLFTLFLLFSPKNSTAQLEFVDPLIGTDAHGHTFPGATLPFGMVQLSPDTRTDDSWDGCSGYHYSDPLIYGFSHTHLSGTGVPDYADILVQPYIGRTPTKNNDYASKYSKKNQIAEAGFYSVFLDKPQTKVELTATQRVGIHRYTFGEKSAAENLLLDIRHRDMVLNSDIKITSPTEVVGKRISNAWASEQHVYFVMHFSKPIIAHTLSQEGLFLSKNAKKSSGKAVFGSFSFENNGEPLIVKVAISGTSIQGAQANMEAEASHFKFDKYKQRAQSTWKGALSKIEVDGGTEEQKTVFYTALYHSMLAPNIYNDVTGEYRGRDNRIHKLPKKQKGYYTVFSLWDTYRALHPLLTILEPERTEDFIRTFLLQYAQGGRLPVWELAANETDCMIGNHAIPVIADAWLKGLNHYDGEIALKAMMSAAYQDRLGLKDYREIGFISSEKEPESVSKTLEYAFDDFAIAKMAESLGEKEFSEDFYHRSQNWKNLYDPSTGFIRARNNNVWHAPFDPWEVNFNYTEANAWQYRFAMPHDINTFTQKLGGDAALEAALDSLFTAESKTSGRHQADITGLVGQYAQGNEPSHHIAYLYNYIGKPHKTQELVYKIRKEQYSSKPDGLCGNEDCGQMSAWLVFNALGFYPVIPVGGEYAIGVPWFDKAQIHLDPKRSFTITSQRKGKADFYVQDVHLNENQHNKSYFHHRDIINGGRLNFLLGNKPNLTWGTKVEDRPKAKITSTKSFIPVPFIAAGTRVFDKKQKVALACDDKAAAIHYTKDGSVPTSASKRYKKPFKIKKTSTIKAIAVRDNSSSPLMESVFNKRDKDLNLSSYNCTYSKQYTARGDGGLVDGLRGGADFRSGGWQGFEGQDFDVVLDLGKKKKAIQEIGFSALQDENSWIFFPKKLIVQASEDGSTWNELGSTESSIDPKEKGAQLQDFKVKLATPAKHRYIRLIGKGQIKCPTWHKGAGHPCWVFVDEVWAN